VLVLVALTLAGALYPWLRSRRRQASAVPDEAKAPRSKWGMLFSAAIVGMLAAALWGSRDFGFRAGLFPWAIGIPVLALATVLLVLQLAGREGRPENHLMESDVRIPADVVARRTAGILGWIVGYLAAIWLLGFTLGGTLCTFLALKYGGRERWPITIAMTAGVAAFVYFLFERVLHVPFPPGAISVWLGAG
jgi:hypothetical protein